MKAYKVVDAKTDAILYIGSKKECEQFIKKHETIWEEMTLEEIK